MKIKNTIDYKIILIFIFTLVIFAILKLQQFNSFAGVNAELIDWYETTAWNFLNGKFFVANHNIPLFSEHFSPILIFIVPIYYVFTTPYTFIILQALVMALAVIPLYYLTSHYFTQKFVPVGICLIYFFSRVVNYGLMFDFHLETAYPVLIFSILLFSVKKKWVNYYIFLILCLMVKEDAPIALFGLGLYLFFTGAKKHGIITASISLIWFLAAVELIIPYYRSIIGSWQYGFWTYWSDYGTTQSEIMLNLLNPLKNIEVIFTEIKIKNMFNVFSVFLFLPFASIKALVFLILPNLFLLFSTNNTMMYGMTNYYGLVVTPFLFYAAILGIKNISEKLKLRNITIYLVTLMLAVNAANSRYVKLFIENPMKKSDRYNTVESIINNIPPKTSVAAQSNLVGHVSPRENRFFFPQNLDKVKYILLDLKGNKWPLNEEEYVQKIDSLKANANYRIEIEKDDFLLFENIGVKE